MGTEAHSLGWFLFLFKPLSSSRDLGTVCLLLQLETLTEVWSEESSLVAQPEQSLTERDSVSTKALKYRQAYGCWHVQQPGSEISC